MKLEFFNRQGRRVEPITTGLLCFVSAPFPFMQPDNQHGAFSAAAYLSALVQTGEKTPAVSGVLLARVYAAALRLDVTLPRVRGWNDDLIRQCDVVLVAQLPGWINCPLVAGDVQSADRFKKPTYRVQFAEKKE